MTASERLQKEIKSEFDRKFADQMREFVADLDYVDKDAFVLYTLQVCDTDEKKQKMLYYVKKYDITSDQDILTLCIYINDGVEPELKSSDDD